MEGLILSTATGIQYYARLHTQTPGLLVVHLEICFILFSFLSYLVDFTKLFVVLLRYQFYHFNHFVEFVLLYFRHKDDV